jgi:hypothetical protein
MKLKVTGQVFKIGEADVKSEKFILREMVLVEQPLDEYTSYYPIDAVNEDIDRLDAVKEGQWVEVDVVLKGRLWSPQDGRPERCFLSLRLDTYDNPQPITILEGLDEAGAFRAASASKPAPEVSKPQPAQGDDEIPF